MDFVHRVEEYLVAAESARSVGDFCWDIISAYLIEDVADRQFREVRYGALWFQSYIFRTGVAIVDDWGFG